MVRNGLYDFSSCIPIYSTYAHMLLHWLHWLHFHHCIILAFATFLGERDSFYTVPSRLWTEYGIGSSMIRTEYYYLMFKTFKSSWWLLTYWTGILSTLSDVMSDRLSITTEYVLCQVLRIAVTASDPFSSSIVCFLSLDPPSLCLRYWSVVWFLYGLTNRTVWSVGISMISDPVPDRATTMTGWKWSSFQPSPSSRLLLTYCYLLYSVNR